MPASEKKLSDPLSQKNKADVIPLIIVAFAASNRSALVELCAELENNMMNFSWLFIQNDIVEHGEVDNRFFNREIGVSVQTLEVNSKLQKNTRYILEPGTKIIGQTVLMADPNAQFSTTSYHVDNAVSDIARHYRYRTIYILLNGPSRDGIQALTSVKNENGLVLAEAVDYKNNSYYNRYVLNYADATFPASQISSAIERLINHPFTFGNGQQLKNSIDENDHSVDHTFELIKNNLDIDLQQYSARIIASSLERRMAIHGMLGLGQYTNLLSSSEKELKSLYKKISVGLVRFFPNEFYSDIVCQEIITAVKKTDPATENIIVWVAGCGTGQEAYSLAILFDEICRKEKLDYHIIIKATDISAQSIEYANRGWYPQEITEEVSASRLAYYFEMEKNGYRVKPYLQQKIQFIQHDLFNDPPYKKIDLISCRNNMRVFQSKVQKKILSSFFYALKEERFLLLGNADSLGELQSHFEQYDALDNFYVKTSNQVVPIGSLPPRKHSERIPKPIEKKDAKIALATIDVSVDEKPKKNGSNIIEYLHAAEHVLKTQNMGLLLLDSQNTLLRITAIAEQLLGLSEVDIGMKLTETSCSVKGYDTLYLSLDCTKPEQKQKGILYFGSNNQRQAEWEILTCAKLPSSTDERITVIVKSHHDSAIG